MSCFVSKALVNVGGELAKLVPGRVSTEVDACLAYDTHRIVRKVERNIDLVYGGGSVGLMGLISQAVYDGGYHVLGSRNNRDKWKKCIGDKDGDAGLQVNKTQIPNVIAEMHDIA
ncbi:hypothetical protein ACSBR1_038280 [Camellia fascicularis]